MPKFPKVIFVKREQDGDESYLIADENGGLFAETSEPVTVARYELKDKGVIKRSADYTPLAK